MKNMMYFLLCCIATVPVFSQETLWHKGGGIFELNSKIIQSAGVTFDNKYVFYGSKLFDRVTGKSVPSFIYPNSTRAYLRHTSQQARYHIIQDTSFYIYAFHVEDNRAVFIRKTQHNPVLNTIGIDESAAVIAFDDGNIYDLRTGSLVGSMSGWNKYLPFVFSSNMIIYSDTNSSTIAFHVKTGKKRFLKGLDYLKDIHVSPSGSIIVQRSTDSIRLIDITSDSATIYRLILNVDYDYACFIDDNTIALLKIRDTFCMVEKYNIANDSMFQKFHFPNYHSQTMYGSPRISSINHFVRDSKEIDFYYNYTDFETCAGMPTWSFQSLSIISTDEPNKCESFPDRIRIRKNTMTFMDGDSTFVYLDDSSNVYVRTSENGFLINQWKLDIQLREINTGSHSMSYTLAYPHKSFLMAYEDSLYVISVEKRQVTRRVKVSDTTIKFIRYAHDKRFILIVSEAKDIYIVNPENLSVQYTVKCNGNINSAAMVGNILYYACSNSNAIIHYDVTTGTIIDSIPTKSHVIALQSDASSYTQDSPHYITNSSSNAIYKSIPELTVASGSVTSSYSYPTEQLSDIWSIRKYMNFSSDHRSDKMYTVKLVKDSVILIAVLENKFQCYATEDIVFSSNGKYCCTISYEYNSIDMHKFPDISVSVEEQENMTTDRGAMSLWVMGNTVVMDDDIEYTSCDLYTLEGVSMGVCAMTNIGEKIKIQLPENMSSGIYLLRLCDAASGKVRRIMIGK